MMVKKQSGFLIMVIAVLLVIIAALASAFVAMISSGTNSSISTISANSAYDLAQTGLENGSYIVQQGTCNSAWSSSVTITGQGQYQYNCTAYGIPTPLTTTISSALNASATAIPVNSTTNLANFGAISIDSETIYYDGISGNSLQNAKRGQNRTTAASHNLGATVSQSQYVISSQGGAPSLSTPNGFVTLYQAMLYLPNPTYYLVGTNGSNAVTLQYDGVSWLTTTANAGVVLYGVSIMNSTFGISAGNDAAKNAYYYSFNGSWTGPFASKNTANLSAASCDPLNLSLSNCWTVGTRQSGQPSAFNPGTGTEYHGGGNFTLTGVSCYGNCVAVGGTTAYFFASNSTNPFASSSSISPGTATAVHCPAFNSCLIVESSGSIYYYNGSLSGPYTISAQSLNDVHCPTSSSCTIVGAQGSIFTCSLPVTGSSSCSSQTAPGTLNLQGVYCATINDCLAVGVGNIAYHYFEGLWSTLTIPTNNTLNSVSGTAGTGSGGNILPTIFHNQ